MNVLPILYAVNDFLVHGGIALYAIFFIAILLWAMIIERFLYINFFSRREQSRLIEEWQSYQNHLDASKIRETLKSLFQQKLYGGLAVIKMLIQITPLMGLFGTVYGMIEVFDVIAQTGTQDPRAMANGISMATLPTMSGMGVAITGLFFRHQIEMLANKKNVNFHEKLHST